MQSITIHDVSVDYESVIKLSSDASVPRFVIPSKLPTAESCHLLEVLYKSLNKFTKTPFELWIVDNNSPVANTDWIKDLPNVNFVQIKNDFTEQGGSFENGIALELARALTNPETKLMMTFHQDTVVCTDSWFDFLSSKLSDISGIRNKDTQLNQKNNNSYR